jgi:hypothetical protein
MNVSFWDKANIAFETCAYDLKRTSASGVSRYRRRNENCGIPTTCPGVAFGSPLNGWRGLTQPDQVAAT